MVFCFKKDKLREFSRLAEIKNVSSHPSSCCGHDRLTRTTTSPRNSVQGTGPLDRNLTNFDAVVAAGDGGDAVVADVELQTLPHEPFAALSEVDKGTGL